MKLRYKHCSVKFQIFLYALDVHDHILCADFGGNQVLIFIVRDKVPYNIQ